MLEFVILTRQSQFIKEFNKKEGKDCEHEGFYVLRMPTFKVAGSYIVSKNLKETGAKPQYKKNLAA